MSSETEPLVLFYDLLGVNDITWSPSCWHSRYALAYKGIPFETIKLSYPDIKPTVERLFGTDFAEKGLSATVPIIEILPSPKIPGIKHQALNDSVPIAKLLNQVFTPELGFKHLEGVEETEAYEETNPGNGVWNWIVSDVCEYTLKDDARGQEFFRRAREEKFGMKMKDILEIRGGGEEKTLEKIRGAWTLLRERMAKEDGSGEPSYIDFYDAGIVKWVQGGSQEKYEKLLGLYGDDTFFKLMKKVGKYAS